MVIKRTNQLTGPPLWLAHEVTQTSSSFFFFFYKFKLSKDYLATFIWGEKNKNVNTAICPSIPCLYATPLIVFIFLPWNMRQKVIFKACKGCLSFSSRASQPFLNNVNESCQSTPLWSATKVKGSVKTLKCWFGWVRWLPFAPLKIQLI